MKRKQAECPGSIPWDLWVLTFGVLLGSSLAPGSSILLGLRWVESLLSCCLPGSLPPKRAPLRSQRWAGSPSKKNVSDCNLRKTCISLERGSLGRWSTRWRRRSPEATFGVVLLVLPLLGRTHPPLLVGKTPPNSDALGVALLVLLLQKTPILLLGKTPSYSETFGVALLLCKTPPNPNPSSLILL